MDQAGQTTGTRPCTGTSGHNDRAPLYVTYAAPANDIFHPLVQIDMPKTPALDGSKIAVNSSIDGDNEIYVMNADGTGQTRLTNNGVNDKDPA